MGKKLIYAFLVSLMVIPLVIVGCSQPTPTPTPAARVSLLVATFMPTGEQYPSTVAIADFMSKNTNLDPTVKVYAGPPSIVDAIGTEQAQIGMILTSSTVSYGYYAQADFQGKTPQKSMRAVIVLGKILKSYYTTPSTGIKTISDLKGRKVSRYTAAVNDWADIVAQVYGLDPTKDFKSVNVESDPVAITELGAGRIEAAQGNIGHALMLSLKEQVGKVIVLAISPEKFAEAAAKSPVTFAGAYSGLVRPGDFAAIELAQPVPVMEQSMIAITNTGVSEQVVYTFVKALLDNPEKVKGFGTTVKYFSLEFAQKPMPLPYHPGAIKALKEKGLWTQAMEQAHQNALKQ